MGGKRLMTIHMQVRWPGFILAASAASDPRTDGRKARPTWRTSSTSAPFSLILGSRR